MNVLYIRCRKAIRGMFEEGVSSHSSPIFQCGWSFGSFEEWPGAGDPQLKLIWEGGLIPWEEAITFEEELHRRQTDVGMSRFRFKRRTSSVERENQTVTVSGESAAGRKTSDGRNETAARTGRNHGGFLWRLEIINNCYRLTQSDDSSNPLSKPPPAQYSISYVTLLCRWTLNNNRTGKLDFN